MATESMEIDDSLYRQVYHFTYVTVKKDGSDCKLIG